MKRIKYVSINTSDAEILRLRQLGYKLVFVLK